MLIITAIPSHQLSADEADKYAGKNRFQCRTCPYQMILDRRYYERKDMEHGKIEDILGGADSWKNVDKTGTRCVRGDCDSQEAYFRQVQIRSADEPMTSFYKCVRCAAEWREN
ncbi:DNA-directed RNA polymeras-like protein III subunit RPC10 [Polychaeton citri CBS 116435]|uniref:DNA-directed RNA polymerase subunit n=1 Tax=Polychaeton citri CBS 116435 TaxID=1314669 RepID=A0A9P4Q2X8_9PEZI|nr:DNA-directed RNA polymeras-like protein III subunit RPC10 [Polychaeton citri CBS 116435]